MTQLGKCDVCRQRKVKVSVRKSLATHSKALIVQCDEVRPVCGSCKKRNRPCRYHHGKGVRFVNGSEKYQFKLSVTQRPLVEDSSMSTDGITDERPRTLSESGRSFILTKSRSARCGHGMFQTFAPVRLEKPRLESLRYGEPIRNTDSLVNPFATLNLTREPSNDSKLLLKRWTSLSEAISEGYDTRYVLSNWMSFVFCRIGHSDVLDLSVDCFLKAIVTYVNKTQENLAITDAANVKALRSVRATLTSKEVQPDLLLAICLIYQVEVIIIY